MKCVVLNTFTVDGLEHRHWEEQETNVLRYSRNRIIDSKSLKVKKN